MADLVIPIREYIGESCYNWETDTYEWATNCDDLRWAIEYAGYANQPFDRIVLEIGNCYGGSVNQGLEMFHYLQEQGVPILTRIFGTVASMGTVLPLCGDEIEVAQTAQFMVHAPSQGTSGTAAQIAADLKGLQDTTAALAAVYIARTGADSVTVAQWMSQDTWFTAAEALAAGLCTSVVPLAPKTVAAPSPAQARLHRQRVSEAVARADKRISSTAKTAAKPAPSSMPSVKKPITAAVKPAPRAAAPAAKPQARKTLFQQLKDLFNEEEGDTTAEGTETVAMVENTELENGAMVYHEGALAVDVAVFNDEAMTEATADGDYDTADGQVMTVAAGIVTALGPDPAATTVLAESAAVAALRKDFNELKASLTKENEDLKAENTRLKGTKPPMPTARAARANAEVPDPKAKQEPRAAAADMGTL